MSYSTQGRSCISSSATEQSKWFRLVWHLYTQPVKHIMLYTWTKFCIHDTVTQHPICWNWITKLSEICITLPSSGIPQLKAWLDCLTWPPDSACRLRFQSQKSYLIWSLTSLQVSGKLIVSHSLHSQLLPQLFNLLLQRQYNIRICLRFTRSNVTMFRLQNRRLILAEWRWCGSFRLQNRRLILAEWRWCGSFSFSFSFTRSHFLWIQMITIITLHVLVNYTLRLPRSLLLISHFLWWVWDTEQGRDGIPSQQLSGVSSLLLKLWLFKVNLKCYKEGQYPTDIPVRLLSCMKTVKIAKSLTPCTVI